MDTLMSTNSSGGSSANSGRTLRRQSSFSSQGSATSGGNNNRNSLEKPILVYHESARSIVFRDHLRRAVKKQQQQQETNMDSRITETTNTTDNSNDDGAVVQNTGGHVPKDLGNPLANEVEEISHLATEILDPNETVSLLEAGIPETQIANYQPKIVPLQNLQFGPSDEYQDLIKSPPVVVVNDNNNNNDEHNEMYTAAEREVCQLLQEQRCTVKTIKNVDWSSFLTRFQHPEPKRGRYPVAHDDIPPDDDTNSFHFNSFVTSTTLLPTNGQKMRCYGSTGQYTVGVIFSLPMEYADATAEDEAASRTKTWSWPSGYSAKTEFNIDGRGRLINGREEALRPLSKLREYNNDYVNKEEYMVGNRMVSGLSQIPYNEVFLRVGGLGRLVNEHDVSDGHERCRSFDRGVGLPVALFVRSAAYGHLITLLRIRSRMMHVLGERHIKGIPLLLVTPEDGVRVLTESLQRNLWKLAATTLTPFQNNTFAHKTTVTHTDEASFQQKVDELFDLDDDIRGTLTPEELARLAGGFGATDDSVATVLKQVMLQDKELKAKSQDSHKLQDVVNEGLAAAVRSGDYHTSRQLLLLYSLVATSADTEESDGEADQKLDKDEEKTTGTGAVPTKHHASMGMDEAELLKRDMNLVKREADGTLSAKLPSPPPPPPLDTDRLRSATNSDGLLAVLGAAQVLKAMQNGSAKKRVEEAISAVEEWVNYGEQSVAFRISSWYDQRAAQGDLKINTENESKFMAFVSNKAISNRRSFAQQLRDAVSNTDFNNVRFLLAMKEILGRMHSPCLRLELLQYVLGLDNRYSVAHVIRSVELATSCLAIASTSASSSAAI